MPDELDLVSIEATLEEIAPDPWRAYTHDDSGDLLVETILGHDIHIANMEGSCSLCHQIHAFIGSAPTTIRCMAAEIHRLRALVAEEQAKTAHARGWAHWHQNENPFTLNPVDYPRIDERASDGWYGASGSFDAPDEVEEE